MGYDRKKRFMEKLRREGGVYRAFDFSPITEKMFAFIVKNRGGSRNSVLNDLIMEADERERSS
jgi:hypothetical protein